MKVRNFLYGIVAAMVATAVSSCGGQGSSKGQAADSVCNAGLADSAVPNGTVKIVNDSTVRYYITTTDGTMPTVGRIVSIKGKDYKAEIVLTVAKSVTKDFPNDAIYIQETADFVSIFAEPENPKYCSRNGVLFTKDLTKVVWYPSGRPGSSYRLPAGVKTIGNSAFSWSKLTSIDLPEGLEVIDTCAFANCFDLRHLCLPASVTEIQYNAFGMMFEDCVDDEEWIENHSTIANHIDIPQNSKLKRIEADALPYAERLFFPQTLEVYEINGYVSSHPYFEVDAKNQHYSSKEGILFNKDKRVLLLFPEGRKDKYSVPETVKEIGEEAFNFGKKSQIKTIHVPAGVTTIKPGVWGNALNIEVDAINPQYCSVDGVLFSKDKKTLLIYPNGRNDREYTLPEATEEISKYAFCQSQLQKVVISENVKNLHAYTFVGAYHLKDIYLPKQLTEIEDDVIANFIENEFLINLHITSNKPPQIGRNFHIRLCVPHEQLEAYKQLNLDVEDIVGE